MLAPIWISIHAPHEGERLHKAVFVKDFCLISIHAPHEGERRDAAFIRQRAEDFNPRSPRGGATIPELDALADDDISIHAPHEGERYFNAIFFFERKFQSTLPTRGSDAI